MANLSKYTSSLQFKRFTPEIILRWSPSFMRWGAAAGIGLLFFGETIPLVRTDILSNIPIVGKIWAQPVTEEEE